MKMRMNCDLMNAINKSLFHNNLKKKSYGKHFPEEILFFPHTMTPFDAPGK